MNNNDSNFNRQNRNTQNPSYQQQSSNRPQQSGNRPQQGGSRPQQGGSRPQQSGARPPQKGKPPKKKVRFHPNKDGIMAIIALLLGVILVITIIVCVVKAISDAVSSDKPTTESYITTSDTLDSSTTTESTTTAFVTTAPQAGAWNEGYVLQNYSNTKVGEGDLVLVNYEYEYSFPSSMEKKIISMYGQTGHGTSYVLGSNIKLNTTIVPSLVKMLDDMKEANADTLSNGDKLLISSGHRTLEYQQELYDKAVASGTEGYSAKAGYSEHHTGLALDLKIYTSKGATIDLRANEQDWLTSNCANYGFIIRYPSEKTDITQILEESWHFRYIGVPHAQYITENGLCLEEYIELLREEHTYGKAEPLKYTSGDNEYIIYFVPANEAESSTAVPVPASGKYTVSGNNADGFIVTVTK